MRLTIHEPQQLALNCCTNILHFCEHLLLLLPSITLDVVGLCKHRYTRDYYREMVYYAET